MKRAFILVMPILVILVCYAPLSFAALDVFMKIDGIEGEAQQKGHEGEIDVLDWSWGLSQSGTMHIGGGSGTGKAQVQDLSFTKWTDSTTPDLIRAVFNGNHFARVILTVSRADTQGSEFYKMTMEKVLVTSVSTGGSGGEDRLTETVTLNFANVCISYQPTNRDGSPGSLIDACWNIAENTER